MRYFTLILFSLWLSVSGLQAQLQRKVLFLGNSYTGVNNLPQLIRDVASSAGDTLVFDSHTPGGYRLIDHSQDITSKNKIMAGGWDYVVIQGQSQEPIVGTGEFNNGGHALYTLMKQYNPCAVMTPYMTWGRKNGDASNCSNFPAMCTYQGMDTTLRNRYLTLSKNINGELSPVSVVWNYLRQNHPSIELYQADESHPSTAGSYAAACCFYTSLFKKDPTLITYNFGLSASDASAIKNAVKIKVFNHLPSWNFKRMPISDFIYQIGSGVNQVIFNPLSQGVRQSYFWNFGDGITSTIPNPSHSYAANGTYTVTLTTTTCDLQGLHTSSSDTIIQFCSHTPTIYSNNPWLCQHDTIWTEPADAYQWYNYQTPLPENNQYLDVSSYSNLGFSVLATLNGCSELSQTFTQMPEWSGYYFDAIGNPCDGDTVAFAVLHINGFLSGFENILWFKNDTLLPQMTDADTLFISSPGKYECKVIDPNANCPIDTTSFLVEYICSVSGLTENITELTWKLFPNPASETITIQFINPQPQEQIDIYNSLGHLVKSFNIMSDITTVNIADLPNGIYFILPKKYQYHPLKFIKR